MTRSLTLPIALATATALLTLMVGCAPDQESASPGKEIFDAHCAECHGPGGNIRLATQQDPETPDLRTLASRSVHGRLPRVMLARIIDGRRTVRAHGTRTMPIWGEELDVKNTETVEAKIDALVEYIESIQTK